MMLSNPYPGPDSIIFWFFLAVAVFYTWGIYTGRIQLRKVKE